MNRPLSGLDLQNVAVSWKEPLLLAVLLPALIATLARAADDGPLQDPALKRLYAEFQTLFRRYYPTVEEVQHRRKRQVTQGRRPQGVYERVPQGRQEDVADSLSAGVSSLHLAVLPSGPS